MKNMTLLLVCAALLAGGSAGFVWGQRNGESYTASEKDKIIDSLQIMVITAYAEKDSLRASILRDLKSLESSIKTHTTTPRIHIEPQRGGHSPMTNFDDGPWGPMTENF